MSLKRLHWSFILSRVALMLGSFLLSLLLAEILVRLLLPQPLPWIVWNTWELDEQLGWRRKGSLDLMVRVGQGESRLRTDAYGHRVGGPAGTEHPASARTQAAAL